MALHDHDFDCDKAITALLDSGSTQVRMVTAGSGLGLICFADFPTGFTLAQLVPTILFTGSVDDQGA